MRDDIEANIRHIEAETARLREAIRDGDHAQADEISDSIRAALEKIDAERSDEPR